ncbi:hypothetical protein B0H12DRAFT_1126756 [Mycena haematopus]|nr:hypothetical protein B0H12DRAFT_1126756 [Mycena haematopus]
MEGLFGEAMQMLGPVMQNYASQNQDSDDQPHIQAAQAHVQNAQFDPEEHKPPTEHEVQHAASAHKRIYEDNKDVNSETPDAVGGAVVAHVLQQFSGSGGVPDMASLLPMMMDEASSLLGNANAKPDMKTQVMQKIGMMALKSQMGGGGGGMLTILQKFM